MEYRRGSSGSSNVASSSSANHGTQLYPHHHHQSNTAAATGILSSNSSNPSSRTVEKSTDSRIDEETSGADNDNYWNAINNEMADRLQRARESGSDNFIQDHAPRLNKLGIFSTGCILVNRMIGTGIFETPKSVWMSSRSVAASLFMWCLGGLITYAGMVVYLELGLTIPRYRVRRDWKSIPRSGGEKNYLEIIYAIPRFLASCTYAVIFITLGNTAGNGIVFATYFLHIIRYPQPSNLDNDETGWICKGIAAGVVTVACLLHGAWRAGGIWVQNGFAIVKICILWFFIIAGLASYSGKFGDNKFKPGVELKPSNSLQFNPTGSFGPSEGVHGWISALLDVSFSFGGFESANYVLSEIRDPARNLKRSTLGALTLVFISYILANISFFAVVTSDKLMSPENPSISTVFIGTLFPNSDNAKRALPALVAISAFGNLVSATFMNSKVKQEIAKEGVIPFSSFWRREYDSPFSRWFRGRKDRRRASRKHPNSSGTHPRDSIAAALAYHDGQEKTPIPALFLHWITSLVIILAPPAKDTYQIFTRLYSYMSHAWFGVFLAGGLLYVGYYKQYMSDYRARRNNNIITTNTTTNSTGMPLSPITNEITSSRVYANANTDTNISGGTYQWKAIAGFRPILGPVLPFIYFISSLFMVFGAWIPPENGDSMSGSSKEDGTKWYLVPTVGLGLFGFGVVYWFGLVYVLPQFYHKTLRVKRTPFLDREENFRYEDVQTKWIAPGPEEDEVEDDPYLVY